MMNDDDDTSNTTCSWFVQECGHDTSHSQVAAVGQLVLRAPLSSCNAVYNTASPL
jgi:hypothetical protein